MTAASTTKPNTAVITICSANRIEHLLRQQIAIRQAHPEATRIVVWLDREAPNQAIDAVVVHQPPGTHGFKLAAARNAGADAAIASGATLLIFLDADCVPGVELINTYRTAAATAPQAVFCGPVTYLPAGFEITASTDLQPATAPHPSRPAPEAGHLQAATHDEYALFWSLSFALAADTWKATGGFDEQYQGYGAEDTDFAWHLRVLQVPMYWAGGADAYHQYHPTSSPPWQNLDDIVRNAGLFFDQWGEWPMLGWLETFRESGAVVLQDGRYLLSATHGGKEHPGGK